MTQVTGKTQKTDRDLMIVFWNLGIGGVQRKMIDIVEYLESGRKYQNVQVHLIIRDRKSFSLDEGKAFSRTHIHYFPVSIKPISRFLFPSFILWKIVLIKPTSILTFLSTASLYIVAAKRILFWRKIRIILNEDIMTSFDVKSKLKRELIKLFYPHADCIVTPTAATKKDLVDNFGIFPEKIVVIPNWTLLKESKSKLHKQFDLIFIGRFTEQKDIPLLLRVIKQIKVEYPEIKICLLGEGEEEKSVREFINSNGLQNNILIEGAEQNVEKYLKASRLFILTSHYEGMPIALLEAKSVGIPSVITSYTGAEEVVDSGRDGFICYTRKEFVERIHQVLSDKSLRKRLGQYARRKAKMEFSTTPLHKFLVNILQPGTE